MASRARAVLVVLCAIATTACDGDGGVTIAPKVPLAYTRFVNAVSDTGATDWRFIDQIENSPVVFGLSFRGFTPYQATARGARHLRVFPTSTNIDVTSKFLIDTILSFDADTYYTIVHFGFARAGQSPKHQIVVFKDSIPALGDVKVGVRAVNLAVGLGPVDLFASAAGGNTTLPAAPLFAGVSVGASTAYASLDVGGLALRVTNQSARDPILVDATAPTGQPADPTLNLTAIGGSLLGRSVMSALLMPRSVPGSAATSFASPGLVFLIDRHPR